MRRARLAALLSGAIVSTLLSGSMVAAPTAGAPAAGSASIAARTTGSDTPARATGAGIPARATGSDTPARATATTDEVGQIHGTVRDDTGAPVAGATVALLGCAPGCPDVAITNADGQYYIVGVPAAPALGVTAWRGSDLLRQWFPLADSPAQAQRFPLAPGQTKGPIDFSLTRGGHLSVEVLWTRRDEPLRAVVHLIGPQDTHHQYIAHDPVALLDDDPAAGGPAAPVRLRMGPVPPGEYAVRVTPGLPDPGKLPDRWVTRTPAVPRPTVAIVAGGESLTSAALAGTEAPADSTRTDWPGLGAGFLGGSATGFWASVLDAPGQASALRLIPPRGSLGP